MSLSSIIFSYCNKNVIKITPDRGGSYTDSSDWIKNKKATIHHINKKDNKCFQYPVTVTLMMKKYKKICKE